jgi:hypothetical protein
MSEQPGRNPDDPASWMDPTGGPEQPKNETGNGEDHSGKGASAPDLKDCLPFRWGAALSPVLDVQDFVEGVLTTSCLAVVYGDSNVGKSFWTLDLGLHIAGGIKWNEREVEKGIVVLIALEGGAMIDNRVIAARNHLNLPPTVPLVVVQCPVDLRTNTVDAERMANTIKRVVFDVAGPLPVRLVIIDTMSRALNGGAENAEDMSALLANADRVRHETSVSILFIAHTGKDQAKGIRGWSGIRAAIDVEIEVKKQDDGKGFVAEVTKERDLPTGARFAFILEVVELGRNRRGKPVTTCVIQPAEAPAKRSKKEQKLTDKAAEMLTQINLLMARGGPSFPHPHLSAITVVPRDALRKKLIEAGWFSESQVIENKQLCSTRSEAEKVFGALPTNGGETRQNDNPELPTLSKAGYSAESNALIGLKRREKIGFSRDHVWLQ